ncbi:hypothetical protein [Croceiramulus getboli]|nr:hypothetical protein P8624_01740 [Flavobacteriaceae bacterium YJPT1-3]
MNLRLLLTMLAITAVTMAQSPCDTAIKLAPDANLFLNKAYVSTDLEATLGFARKALESFSSLEELTLSCDCMTAYDATYEARVNLEKAMEKSSWEQVRFFVNKARGFTGNLLQDLDGCQYQGPQESDFQSRQEYLEARQQELLDRQKAITRELQEQRKMAEEMARKREIELKQQKAFKTAAESALKQYELALKKLNETFACGQSQEPMSNYMRDEAVLEEESLELTEYYYLNKAEEMHARAEEILRKCRNLK